MSDRMSGKQWLPLLGVAFSAFVFNTSEFIPIGLLTDIATDFRITEAKAGMLISVYAWVVTVLSLPLMLLVSKMDFRRLLLATVGLFCLCQVLSGLSSGYIVLMFSRIGVACAHAVFWSIASPAAVRVVPPRFRSLALSMIVTGTSVAMIFGLPLGRIIGLYIGWRATFFCIAALSFVIWAYLFRLFPEVPAGKTFSLHALPGMLKNPLLIGIYVMSFAIATSYYTGYSYIEPFLKQAAGMSDGWITGVLIVFGAFGIVGSLLFSRYYDRYPYGFIACAVSGITASLFLLYPASFLHCAIVALCAFWGMSVTAFNVVFQAETIKSSPVEATAVSMSIFSGIFNLGIGCGTFIGGAVCTYFSLSYIGFAGGAIALLATVYCCTSLFRLMKKRESPLREEIR